MDTTKGKPPAGTKRIDGTDGVKGIIHLVELEVSKATTEEEEKECIAIEAQELVEEEEAGEVPRGSGLIATTGKGSNEDSWTWELVGAGDEQEDDGEDVFVDAEEHHGEGDKTNEARVEGAEN